MEGLPARGESLVPLALLEEPRKFIGGLDGSGRDILERRIDSQEIVLFSGTLQRDDRNLIPKGPIDRDRLFPPRALLTAG